MHTLFISRSLEPDSVLKQQLEAIGFSIIDQSLLTFTLKPFSKLPECDWIFFYSKTGVQFFFEGLKQPIEKPIKWAAIGESTGEALKKRNILPDFIGSGNPQETARDFLPLSKGKTVLFVRAKKSKKSVQTLLKNEITIRELVVYENQIKKDFEIPPADFLIFTSPLNVKAYFQKYTLLPYQTVFAIGKTTEKALHSIGIKEVLVPKKPSETALAELVLKYFN